MTGIAEGIALGQHVAAEILAWRASDGSNGSVPYTIGTEPGDWQPTPPAFNPDPSTPQWGSVTPFALDEGSQFRPGPPPALTSADYTEAFLEVKDLGRIDSTTRTPEQTEIALFWATAGRRRLEPDHRDGGRRARPDAGRERPAVRAGQRRERRRVHRLVRRQVHLQLLAAGDGDPRRRHGRQPGHRSGRDLDAAHRHAEPPVLRVEPLEPRAGPRPRRWRPSSAPTTSASRPRRPGSSVRTRRSRRRRRRAAGAGSTPGSTGVSTVRSPESNWAGRSAGTSRTTTSGRWTGRAARHSRRRPRPLGRCTRTLRDDQVQPLLTEALARWQAAGVDTSALHGVDVRIADLGGLTLGRAADGVIWLDDNAAGWGWFVDRSPRDGRRVRRAGEPGRAEPDGPADGVDARGRPPARARPRRRAG